MGLRRSLLAAAALAAFGTFLVLSRWGAGGYRDLVSLAWEVQRGDELGTNLEVARRRNEAKQALAAEVVAGRMTVREAADHFGRLDETDPSYPPGLPRSPGYERALCRNVLN